MAIRAVAGSSTRSGLTDATERPEAGFTLVEVMVVVLILGVLMTVATPTLLGARERVWDLAARSSVRTSMTTAILLSEFRSDFTFASATAMAAAEPGLTFVEATTVSTGPKIVSVDASSASQWVAVARSQSGSCYAVIIERSGQWSGNAEACSADKVTRSPAIETLDGRGIFAGPAPDGARIGANSTYESDEEITIFDEGRHILTSDLLLNGGAEIPSGTAVCSYLFLYSPVSSGRTSLTVDLGGTILGSARTSRELSRTSSFGNPQAVYENRAWENGDGFLAEGSVLTLKPYAVANNADMVRVFTACP